MTLSLPPFTPGVVWLLGINTGIFLLLVLLMTASPELVAGLVGWFGLRADAVLHGMVWQLVTYSALHVGLGHWFWNMFGIWMFGSAVEGAWGMRRFFELYVAGVLGGAVVSMVLSYSGVLGSPNSVTIGASGGVYAILMAFGIVYAENEILLIPFPFRIKAKYFISILILLTAIFSIQGRGGVAHLAHLGGLLFGYLYVKSAPARGLTRGRLARRAGQSTMGLRDRYYRWKRRRAARKFEVYMRKHNRTVYFDEYGNYVPPDEMGKDRGDEDDGPKRPWVH